MTFVSFKFVLLCMFISVFMVVGELQAENASGLARDSQFCRANAPEVRDTNDRKKLFDLVVYPLTDSSSEQVIQQVIDQVYCNGGGTVRLAAGAFEISRSIVLRSGVVLRGAGMGATKLRLERGANTDIIITDTPEVSPETKGLKDVASGIGILDMTLDGNWLRYPENTARIRKPSFYQDAPELNNSRGSALWLRTERARIRVRVENVAEHFLWIEGPDRLISKKLPGFAGALTDIWLEGRESGREGVVIKGPSDTYYKYIAMGRVGKAPPGESQPVSGVDAEVFSSLYIDKGAYIGFVHTSGNRYGPGVFIKRGRTSIDTLITEHNREGVLFGKHAGKSRVGFLEARGLWHKPRHYVRIDANRVMIGTLRINRYGDKRHNDGGTGLVINGNSNIVGASEFVSTHNKSTNRLHRGSAIKINGNANRINAVLDNVEGDGINIRGSGNHISFTANKVKGVVLIRHIRSRGRGNIITGTSTRAGRLINSRRNIKKDMIKIIEY